MYHALLTSLLHVDHCWSVTWYVCLHYVCLCPVGVTVRRGEAPSPRRNAGGDEAARARLTKREVDPVPLTGGEVDPALRTRNGAAPALRTENGVGPALPIEGGVAHVHHTGNGVGPAPREDPAGLSHLTGSAAVLRSRSGTASATSGDTRADETSPPPQNQIHLLLGKLLILTMYSFLFETVVP